MEREAAITKQAAPLISIIIPVYNVEAYINDCMSSILKQNTENVEIIMVNDGSKDSSLSICEKYAEQNECISVYSQTNQGLSAARNTGISKAKGKYILFLDSDDCLADSCLDRLKNDLKENESDIYLGRSLRFIDGTKDYTLCQVDYSQFNNQNPAVCFAELNKTEGFWFAAWLVIIKKDFLLEHNLYFRNGIYHEDELWVPTVFARAKTLKFLNYGFYCYRVGRAGSIVFSHKIKREFDKLIVVDELNRLYNISIESKEMIGERSSSLVFGIILSLVNYKKDSSYEDLLKSVKLRLPYIKCRKYKPVYTLCRFFGVALTSIILNYVYKKKIEQSVI